MKPANPKLWTHRYVIGEAGANPEVKARVIFEEHRPSGTPDERGVIIVLGAAERRCKYIIGPQVKDVLARRVSYRCYEVEPRDHAEEMHAELVAMVKRAPHQVATLLRQLLGSPFAVCRAVGSYRDEVDP